MAGARSTKTPAPEAPVEEYDFDNWDDESEAKALAELAPNIKHIIVERHFVGRFTDGRTIKVPLSLSLNDVDVLQEEHANEIDQFRALISVMGGGEEAAAEFSSQDLTETALMAQRYFGVLARRQGAPVPES